MWQYEAKLHTLNNPLCLLQVKIHMYEVGIHSQAKTTQHSYHFQQTMQWADVKPYRFMLCISRAAYWKCMLWARHCYVKIVGVGGYSIILPRQCQATAPWGQSEAVRFWSITISYHQFPSIVSCWLAPVKYGVKEDSVYVHTCVQVPQQMSNNVCVCCVCFQAYL